MIVERVLIVHNAYQKQGGEDLVVEAETALLRACGHEIETYSRNNEDVDSLSVMALAQQTLWSERTSQEIRSLVARFQPDVIHVHNTFPLISPSLYWSADRVGVAVVQTLHNFRMICLNALFLREGKVCEDCMGRLPWRGVTRACYRKSRPASAVVAGMLTLHRGLGTYRNKVSRYIALTDFSRSKFIEAGLPADRVVVKPNFVDIDAPAEGPRRGLLFVGRLSQEKGIATLADAARILQRGDLRVVGDGPEMPLIDGLSGVACLGPQPNATVRSEMARAGALVVPSICYENFPRTVVEAYASGLPVIASRIGALAEIVRDGETGLLFEPGNAEDLAAKMAWAQANPDALRRMGANARLEYERLYTPERNYQMLMQIYQDAIEEHRRHAR